MIIFFYGQDSYRLAQSEKKLKEKFISASLGDTNLAVLDVKKLTFDEYIRQILAMPFLSKTRLVIVENILSEAKKELQEKIGEVLNKVPESTVLLFTETAPDKRLSLFKKLVKVDKVQEFLPMEEIQIKRWIKSETEAKGGEIDSASINLLYESVGGDLWRLSNELDKLITFNHKITTGTIELLVQSQAQKDIFRLVDALGNKNLKKALNELNQLQHAGENEIYIFSMICYQYRNLLIVKDLQDRLHSSNAYPASGQAWAIQKEAGMNPYVVQKTLAQCGNFTFDELKNSYDTLLDFDHKLKTGKIGKEAALALLVVKLSLSRNF
ncbi:TPA: DNA polymerase III subunit delta [Candidatus Berkelbacteria bacterium]|uniref:DNA polymerase III subunit delta n=1 Tax=Berkelbacteria bacterium GW2011_GWE1_39_12 TaxID=1618337 RepID=A0A0G4B419_9BACT|nr:MAG: polymerase III subunit delta, DNA polymerase III subunit delta protein [Berkelbacteria bacterium GW2011_GWE1_39_12]HBO60901.1 DNA polymerase III subunit delta [Candidatus Berkelbacteria bacterium]